MKIPTFINLTSAGPLEVGVDTGDGDLAIWDPGSSGGVQVLPAVQQVVGTEDVIPLVAGVPTHRHSAPGCDV